MASTCANATHCLDPTERCVPSRFGELCAECSFLGYLTSSALPGQRTCECYGTEHSDRRVCAPPPVSSRNRLLANLTLKYEKTSCEAFNSTVFGCFKPVNSSAHKFGARDPPIPNECCEPYLGPPPGELTEFNFINEAGTQFYYTCNTHGGLVREGNFSGFRTCHGRGSFNFTSRECECDRGFRLEPTTTRSCTACAKFWGPAPDGLNFTRACSRVYTPNLVTGELQECSGNGRYTNEGCSCFDDAARGFFRLVNLTSEIWTCAQCKNSSYTLPLCKE